MEEIREFGCSEKDAFDLWFKLAGNSQEERSALRIDHRERLTCSFKKQSAKMNSFFLEIKFKSIARFSRCAGKDGEYGRG